MKTARDITKALGGKWYNYYGTAPCPVCQKNADKTHNVLTISDGNDKLLMHCKKSNCNFKDLVIACGLDLKCPSRRTAQPGYGRVKRTPDYSNFAKKAWRKEQPVQGMLIAAQMKVIQIARIKTSCRRCERMVQERPQAARSRETWPGRTCWLMFWSRRSMITFRFVASTRSLPVWGQTFGEHPCRLVRTRHAHSSAADRVDRS